jgi:hypothetical protein
MLVLLYKSRLVDGVDHFSFSQPGQRLRRFGRPPCPQAHAKTSWRRGSTATAERRCTLVLEPGDDRAGVEPVRVHALLLHERQPRGREVGGVEAERVPAEALHVAPVDEHDAVARPSQGVLHAERRIRKRRRRLIGVITRR